MNILISNDDGFLAPGIAVLAKVLSEIANVTVVAPDRDRSGASNSLTLDRPLRVVKSENGFYHANGTPTDCVHLAVTGLLEVMPDMVVSGINRGSNVGDDILYSGTVAAATEGRSLGLPSIAISLADPCRHYMTAALIAKALVEKLRKNPLPSATILNVNVPDVAMDQIKGIEVTRLGTRHLSRPSIKDIDPRDHEIYWIGLPGEKSDAGPGTDFHAIMNNYVSITPIKVDLTQYNAFEQLSSWVKGFGNFG